jgi:hypothetical protein
LRAHVALFFKHMRSSVGRALPYAWVAEWHKSGHGLHVHFAVGEFVPRPTIEAPGGRGFVHIKRLGKVEGGGFAKARRAAAYLSKYVGKSFDEDRVAGLHRYEVAQGFQPSFVRVWGATAAEVVERACDLFDGQRLETVWSSRHERVWLGLPAVWVSWAN